MVLLVLVATAGCSGGGGSGAGDDVQVNSFTAGAQRNSRIAVLEDDSLVIVWESFGQDGDGWGVVGQRLDDRLDPIGTEFVVNTITAGDQYRRGVRGLTGGGFLVSWRGASNTNFARRYNSNGDPSGAAFQIEDGLGHGYAIDGEGRFVVVFEEFGPGGGNYNGGDSYPHIAGWRTDQGGVTDSPEVQFSDYARTFEAYAADQYDPAVAASGGGEFVVVWSQQDYYDGHHGFYGSAIYGQRITANLDRDGSAIDIGSRGSADDPEIAINDAGSFVVVWSFCSHGYYDPSCVTYGLEGRQVRAAGGGRRFLVSETDDGQYVDGGGRSGINEADDFVVVWHRTEDDDTDIFADVYSADGTLLEAALMVNDERDGSQCCPDVAVLDNGAFVVTWTSDGQDGNDDGVFARRFTPDANVGDEVPAP